jgi:hypothetical protein
VDQLVTLNRRELLKTATGLLSGYVVAGSPLALIAPGRVWAVDLAVLTSSEGATLMSMTRTIAPHDKLDDASYALVIKALDGDAHRDANILKVIKEGAATLGPEFAAGSESVRVARRRFEI